MTRRIQYAGTLAFYDGIQVFEGRDEIGGHYIAVLVEDSDDHHGRYLMVGISPFRLQDFRLGNVDLLALIESRPDPDWYLGTLAGDGTNDFVNAEWQSGKIPQEYLPDPGFVLSLAPDSSPDWLRQQSVARNVLAIELSLESTTPKDQHRAGAEVLAGLIIHVQSLLKNAYRKAITQVPLSVVKHIDRATAAMVDVAVPAAPGSFKVLLVPTQLPNLFNQSEVSRALDVVDFILKNASDTEATLDRVRKYSGHTANAFVRLLRFVADSNVALQYAWVSPDKSGVSARTLTKTEALPLLAMLSQVGNIATEKFTVAGKLKKVDVASGAWRIESFDDGKEYSGYTREGITLSGLVIDNGYLFKCEEELEETIGTGRETRTLYLAKAAISTKAD
jgi:hypothetical protein